MGSLERLVRRLRYGRPIVIVSGLPRSGTSMMMQMLHAGGLEILTDAVRTPDGSNPKGYFELEAVKDLDKGGSPAWLAAARGKAVKIVSSLVRWLPESHDYQVIFMQRNLDEVVASQNKMLADRGSPQDEDQNGRITATVPDAHRGHAPAAPHAPLLLHARGRLQRDACASRGDGPPRRSLPGASPRRRPDGGGSRSRIASKPRGRSFQCSLTQVCRRSLNGRRAHPACHRFLVPCGRPSPRFRVTMRSGGTPVNDSIAPSGHSTTTASTRASAPMPKCTRLSPALR